MRVTNRAGLPEALVRAAENDPYDPGSSDYTVTGLIKPPRLAAIARAHEEELEEDVIDRVWAMIGSAIHLLLERGEVQGIAEKRLYETIAKKRIGGRFDRIDAAKNDDGSFDMSDYKLTSVWNRIYKSSDDDWEAQLNVLAYLAESNGYKINKLEIIAIYKDWRQSEYEKAQAAGKPYPEYSIERIEFPKWKPEAVKKYMEKRIKLHEAARKAVKDGVEPVECSEEERWWDPRKKRSNRCGKYCPAAPWCAQHKREMMEGGEEL